MIWSHTYWGLLYNDVCVCVCVRWHGQFRTLEFSQWQQPVSSGRDAGKFSTGWELWRPGVTRAAGKTFPPSTDVIKASESSFFSSITIKSAHLVMNQRDAIIIRHVLCVQNTRLHSDGTKRLPSMSCFHRGRSTAAFLSSLVGGAERCTGTSTSSSSCWSNSTKTQSISHLSAEVQTPWIQKCIVGSNLY